MSVKKTQDPIIVTPPKPLPIPSPTFSLEEGEEGEGAAGILIDYDPKADYKELYEETEYKTLNPQD